MGDVFKVGTRTQCVVDPFAHDSSINAYTDSDIIHVNALGTSIVILNSYKVATELLDGRSSIYSSRYGFNIPSSGKCAEKNPFLVSIRPHFTMFHEL